jgi:hypothetical protein
VDDQLILHSFPLRSAFQTLLQALENQLLDVGKVVKQPKLNSKPKDPFVVLAFDEVHALKKASDDDSWSCFGEICCAIRGLKNESVFTLFLSTSGTLFSITPNPQCDISTKMVQTGDVVMPFYELGFDQLAVGVDFSKMVTLSQVTSGEHFASYGRPLYVQNTYIVWPMLTLLQMAPLL